ncbi:RtcB family protein [Clostridiales bacterium F-3ap]|uniref:tRNA-splicing ligase RtcB n=2 Tax=Anaerotalea alkaliphila TaxID=2662126 RepID=A0A7X5HWM3_9FIRM|nr:RtcB family protein [Anaerotalea alkaliphila]
MDLRDLRRIHPYLWEIPAGYREDMRIPCRIFASKEMLEEIVKDRSLEQLVNVSALPGMQKAAYVMPDVHEGYGFPIGGVAAAAWPDGVISPGGIGYDINCGVRLLKTELSHQELQPHLRRLGERLYMAVPSGVGKSGFIKLSKEHLDKVLEKGVPWLADMGYGGEEDIDCIESRGCLENGDPSAVSSHAKGRGIDQLGTLGAGNHFVEIDRITHIYDQETASAFGLFEGQVVIQIHTGSRGLGHQVATDHIKVLLGAMRKYGITVPDRELACAPLTSPEGKEYAGAMAAAANFAWANRQAITFFIRKTWHEVLGDQGGHLSLLYDVAHNIAKVEEHRGEDGVRRKMAVHRKGATRAFGPGHPEVTPRYRNFGQPVIIPGSMGTASYVLAGTESSMELAFGSCCHGAGRQMSRHAAKRAVRGERVRDDLHQQGIQVYSGSMAGLAEEAPMAYKDVDAVVDVVEAAGIAKKVAKLRPILVIKG